MRLRFVWITLPMLLGAIAYTPQANADDTTVEPSPDPIHHTVLTSSQLYNPELSVVTWEQVEYWIWLDAQAYGVPGWWLINVARCEGAGNPYAVGRLGEYGPFQFHPTGIWWSTPLGLQGVGPYQASIRDQISMAAWAFSKGLSYHWACAR